MKLVGVIIGAVLFFLIILIERWNTAYKRRERDRAINSDNLRHITGSSRRWWKEPSGDELDDDY